MNKYKKEEDGLTVFIGHLKILGVMGAVLGLLFWAVNSGWCAANVDRTEGAYSAKSIPPSGGDSLDKRGTAFNEVDDFWKRSVQGIVGVGRSSYTLLSTSQWTVLGPSTGSISQDRSAVWLDAKYGNTADVLINVVDLRGGLTMPATDYGLVMRPSDSPWSIQCSTEQAVIGISLGNAERVFTQELK